MYCSASPIPEKKKCIVKQVICDCNNLIIIYDNQQPMMDIPDANDIIETHMEMGILHLEKEFS